MTNTDGRAVITKLRGTFFGLAFFDFPLAFRRRWWEATQWGTVPAPQHVIDEAKRRLYAINNDGA